MDYFYEGYSNFLFCQQGMLPHILTSTGCWFQCFIETFEHQQMSSCLPYILNFFAAKMTDHISMWWRASWHFFLYHLFVHFLCLFFLIALLAFLHKHDLRETLIFVEYGPSVYIMCPEAWRNQVNVCIDQCSWIALTPSFHPQGETERPTGRWGGGKPWNFCRWHSH